MVDVRSGQVLEAIENPATEAAHGAGIQAANLGLLLPGPDGRAQT